MATGNSRDAMVATIAYELGQRSDLAANGTILRYIHKPHLNHYNKIHGMLGCASTQRRRIMPQQRLERAGHQYGRLTVLPNSEKRHHSVYWECRCVCGSVLWVSGSNLSAGTAKSCGCLRRERWANGNMKTHGMTGTPLYAVWRSMKSRCYNPKNQDYDQYGGRGITVCDSWMDSFESFYEDMASTYEPGLTLEREDVNGNYEPFNCIWATMRVQQNNRRNTRRIDSPWGMVTIRRASELSGLPITTIKNRLHYKWPASDIFGPRRWADDHR